VVVRQKCRWQGSQWHSSDVAEMLVDQWWHSCQWKGASGSIDAGGRAASGSINAGCRGTSDGIDVGGRGRGVMCSTDASVRWQAGLEPGATGKLLAGEPVAGV
jgi:hypothetical protein